MQAEGTSGEEAAAADSGGWSATEEILSQRPYFLTTMVGGPSTGSHLHLLTPHCFLDHMYQSCAHWFIMLFLDL